MISLKWLTRIGPAFVIAAVVLGPGSVTTMTKMGASQGYAMVWLPLVAGCLMAGFVTLFMRFGIFSSKSFLQHCADTWGRWFAVLAGFSMFYVATAFQFGNNIGVTTAINSLITPAGDLGATAQAPVPAWVWPVAFNALALFFLFGCRRVYTILEKSMVVLVAVMLLAFLLNLFFTKPDLGGVVRGFVPTLPEGLDWVIVAGLVATTFSIVGAIFQTYLVRARGWGEKDFSKGVADAISGIGMLTLISIVIMITSAAVFFTPGETGGAAQIRTAADMAAQLNVSLGGAARFVFCMGFAAAAFSSFLVNAMIGGVLLSDGLGLGDDINSKPVKVCSALSLIIGMVVAMLVTYSEAVDAAGALIAALAGTMLAIPLAILSALLVLLHSRPAGVPPLNAAAKVFVALGTAVLVVIAARSCTTTIETLREMFGG